MKTMHRCPDCNSLHSPPKASRWVIAMIRAALLIAVAVYAALEVDGLLAAALWVVAACHAAYAALGIVGLVLLASAQVNGKDLP